ncbi:RICIN domain-containing protein [Enterococcus rivorum]|uniref:Uncharacterized protein n=1 Tax=Enterococcus rivorum TaxID=762845 RepID=A0A1E5KY94_9ENTE|nr:RICIN domain-containing protein [Enterococcus rivorum]MBP2099964.1 hypothetical protein [Enterococcus rivorum]OEH82825.1 hypothetical protein BCR26_11395 [Enterococcus rivorum]
MVKKTLINFLLMTLFGVSLVVCQRTPIVLADQSESTKQSSQETSATDFGGVELETSTPTESESSISSQKETESSSATKPKKPVIKPKAGPAPGIINDFYIIKPKLTKNQHLVVDFSLIKQNLHLYPQHGMGNQLFGVEWRPESNAYIIFLSSDKQILLKPAGNSAGSKITAEKQQVSVNNLSHFSDEYLWEIESAEGHYNIINKKNKLVLTLNGNSNHTSGDDLILGKRNGGDNQLMSIQHFNGYYSIKSEFLSTQNQSIVFDIQGGIGRLKNIISYPYSGNSNQQWFVLYSSDVNGYVIGNAKDKTILISSDQGTENPPLTRSFNKNVALPTKFKNILYPVGDWSKKENVYEIWAEPGYIVSSKSGAPLTYKKGVSGSTSARWELIQLGTIPPPNLVDFTLDKKSKVPMYYAGEPINFSAKVQTEDFKFVTAFARRDSEKYTVMDKDLPVANHAVDFTGDFDTSNMSEGEHFVEMFVKGDGLFVSNALAARVKIVYPTPTAERIPHKVYLNRRFDQLKVEDFVKDVKDEMSNPIETKLVSLDTSKLGETKAVISLANQYKEVKIEVPIEIVKEPAKLSVDFMNEAGTLLPGYNLTLNGFVGDPIDLTKEQEVIDQLLNIKRAGYEIVGKPENETSVAMNTTAVSVKYKLQGLITLSSAPKTLDFGTLTYDAKDKKVDSPSFDQKLVVTDTRADASKGFSVTAALTKPLTNEKGDELKDVLSYVYQDEEKKLTEYGQEIYRSNSGIPGSYAITDVWENPEEPDGLKLKIKGTTMLYTGKYQGVITWKIMAGQP